MTDLESQLLDECRRITQHTLFNYDKAELISEIWTTEEREKLAQRYFEQAKDGLKYVAIGGHDPAIVLRAVRYLSVHAMPPLRDSTEWFWYGLHTLLVLACPDYATAPGGEPFFADIRRGMAQAERDGGVRKR